jgi:N-sulfoglucosamine sulfohydrolase
MQTTSRRAFLRQLGLCAMGAAMPTPLYPGPGDNPRPNILFAFADDWTWPHSHGVDDPVVKTPTFDRVAREGVLFEHAFVSSPSCTPSRGAILTGQWHWRLEEGANLFATLPAKFEVYPDLLEEAGYHVGYTRKGWGPGKVEAGGRTRNPAGPSYKDFRRFLEARPSGAPFCFWFGAHEPHRGYEKGSGVASGMKPEDVRVPACLPDADEVRSDLCDYYFEVQRYDRETGELLEILEQMGDLDNTIVVMSGDNGLPFPRCKCNLYDTGTRVPLAVRWPRQAKGGRVVSDFISLCDLAPTFLEAAGLEPLAAMTARGFLDVLLSEKSGQVDPSRDHVLTGRERHVLAQPEGMGGYPMRAIRTRDFLYIANFKPDRWPAGAPETPRGTYRDVDGSPTKTYMMDHRDDPAVAPLFDLSFGKRPAEELYDLLNDPDQLSNVADREEFQKVKEDLAAQLMSELRSTRDPRVLGRGDVFDTYEHYRKGEMKADFGR